MAQPWLEFGEDVGNEQVKAPAPSVPSSGSAASNKPWLQFGSDVVGSVQNQPQTVEAQRALQRDLPPPPVRGRYDPNQSFGGYLGNEFYKNIAGILGLPDTAMRTSLQDPASGLPFITSQINQLRKGVFSVGDPNRSVRGAVGSVLGVDPNIKPPSPYAEAGSAIATDVIENLAIPGAGLLLKVLTGAGSGIGRVLGKGGGPLGEVAGSIAGAMAGGRLDAPLRAGAKGLKFAWDQRHSSKADVVNTLKDAIDEIKTNPSVRESVRKGILDELSEDLRKDSAAYAQKLDEAQRLSDFMRSEYGIDLQLNLGQMTTAPSVIGQQKAIAKADLNLSRAQHDRQQAGLRQAMRGEGAVEGEARGAITGVLNRSAAQVEEAERAVRNQELLIQTEAQKYDVPIDQVELGTKALKMRSAARAEQVAIADDIEREVRQLGEGAKFDLMDVLDDNGSSLIGRAREITRSPVWSSGVIPETARVLKRLGLDAEDVAKAADDATPALIRADAAGTPFPRAGETPQALQSFDSIFDLRKAINADIAAAQSSLNPNSGSLLWALRALKRDLDATMRNSSHTEVVDRYFDWIDHWRENVGGRFDRGVSKLASRKNLLGESRLPPEQVFRQFFKPKNASNMDRFLKVYGGSPESIDMMEKAIMDRYLDEVVDKVSFDISPQKHASFMNRYREPLSVLEKNNFGIKSRLDSQQGAYRAMVDRRAELQLDLEMKQKDQVAQFLKGEFGNEHPNRIFTNALKKPAAMDAVMSRMSTTERRSSMRYIGDVIMRRVTDTSGNVSGNKLRDILRDPEQADALKVAFDRAYGSGASQQHMKRLEDFAEIADRIETTSLGPAQATPARGLYEDTLTPEFGFSWKTLFNMGRAIAMGRNNPIFASTVLGSQAGLTQMQNFRREVMKEVIEDPQTAKQLHDLMKGPISGGSWAKAARWLKTKAPKAFRAAIGPIEETAMRGSVAAGAEVARNPQEQQ